MPREIDRPRGDVHVHDPVNNFRLQVSFVLVDYKLLAGIEELYKC